MWSTNIAFYKYAWCNCFYKWIKKIVSKEIYLFITLKFDFCKLLYINFMNVSYSRYIYRGNLLWRNITMLHFIKFLIARVDFCLRNHSLFTILFDWMKGGLDEQNFNWCAKQAKKVILFRTSKKVLYVLVWGSL